MVFLSGFWWTYSKNRRIVKLKVNVIKITFFASGLAAVFLTCGGPATVVGKEVPLGSADFVPSPAQPVGWRGDWTGKYPGATPPVHWGRTMKQMGDWKCSAAMPKDNLSTSATPAKAGYFTEWLVAVPISSAGKTNAIKDELVSGEASLAPQEGDKIGETTWKRVWVDDSCIDIWKFNGPMTTQQAAYAQACLYSEKPVKIWLHFESSFLGNAWQSAALWFNGARQQAALPFLKLDLKPGWNRILFKVTPRLDGKTDFPQGCYIKCRFWPAEEPREYEEKNIAWIAPMPGLSEANPVIVGDKIFTTAHPYNLVCVDKKTGKVLWIRQNSPYDAAAEDEKKAKPDIFAKLDILAAQRSDYYRDYLAGQLATNQTAAAEEALEDQMDKLMLDVDQKYKRPDEQGEPDWWEIPTPASDGKNICIYVSRGVAACYDLDGKRRWIRYERPKGQHHGYFTSPIIADGKFIIYDGKIAALDLGDGSVKWSVDDTKPPGASGKLWFASLARAVMDGTEYVLCPGGGLMIRAKDGQVSGNFNWGNVDSTPVFFENKILQAGGPSAFVREVAPNAGGTLTIQGIRKNGREAEVKWPDEMPVVPGFYQGHYLETSPLVHSGLAYLTRCWGSLAVLDLEKMEILYERPLPLDLFQIAYRRNYQGASVTMAGDYVYIMGSAGEMIVMKAGRKYEEVGRNRIHYLATEGKAMGVYNYPQYYAPRCDEYQDCTMTATPIFEGNRMYFRGMAALYCVEQNVWAFQTMDTERGEAPLTVKFDASKSCGMPGRKLAEYAWDFSDGQTASGPSAGHTYKAAGTYIARLTVTDDKGATDEAETTITVMPVDTVAPAIKSVTAGGEKGATNVTVQFSEKVEQASAGNAGNYTISRDVKVLHATLDSDAAAVTLATTPLAENVKYELTAGNVRDCARQPNMIAQKSGLSFYRFRSPPDEEGYIRDWLMLEQILTGEKDALNREYFAGDKTAVPNAGEKVTVDGKELAWKYFPATAAVINLAFANGKKSVYYCVAYIDCNADIPDLHLRIGGSHDSSRWSLNDRELIRVNAARGLDRELCVSEPVTLRQGRNVLRAKVVMDGWPGGGFCARFVDKDGKPIGDYNISIGQPAAPHAAP